MSEYQIKIIELLRDGYSTKELVYKIGYSLSWIEKEKVFLKNMFNAKSDAQLVYNYYFKNLTL
jgi:DNA-binding CsgD family transcriptional regulator